MKKLIALAVLASTTAAYSASDIYDLMYLPSAGTAYGFTTAAYTDAKLDGKGLDKDTTGYVIEQTLGYSFNDRLSAQLSFDYTNLESDPKDGEKYDESVGFSDPSLSARYRLMDEGFRWDIGVGLTLALMDKEPDLKISNGSVEKIDYDNHQGGHSFEIGTQIGQKTEGFQWAIAAQFTHYLKSEAEYQVSGGDDIKVKDDAHNQYLVRGDVQFKLAESSFLEGHLAAQFTDSYKDDQDPKNETAPVTAYNVGAEYKHVMSSNLLLRAGVDYFKFNLLSGQVDDFTS